MLTESAVESAPTDRVFALDQEHFHPSGPACPCGTNDIAKKERERTWKQGIFPVYENIASALPKHSWMETVHGVTFSEVASISA